MIDNKPNKTPYENQKEVHNKIVKILKDKYLRYFSKAYLMGSIVSGTFGVYDKEFEGYLGSDIDFAAIPKEKIPNHLKYKGIIHGWDHEYILEEIEFNGIKHPLTLIVPLKNDISLFFNKMKEFNKKSGEVKMKINKGCWTPRPQGFSILDGIQELKVLDDTLEVVE